MSAARKRVPKGVVAFASTGDAMAVEAAARAGGVPGRMIPVPQTVSAGCGLAWCASAEERDALVQALEGAGLAYEALHEVELY